MSRLFVQSVSLCLKSLVLLRAAIKSNSKLVLYSLKTGNIFSERKKIKSFFNRGHRTEVKQFEDWKGAANAVKAVASVPGGLGDDYKYGEDGDYSVSGGLSGDFKYGDDGDYCVPGGLSGYYNYCGYDVSYTNLTMPTKRIV